MLRESVTNVLLGLSGLLCGWRQCRYHCPIPGGKGPVISSLGASVSKNKRIKLRGFEGKWKTVNAPRLPSGVSELVSLVLGTGRVCQSFWIPQFYLDIWVSENIKHFISENEDNVTFCLCRVRLGTGHYSLLLKSSPWILRGTAAQKELS